MVNPESNFSAIITHELEPEIYSIKGLNAFLKLLKPKNYTSYTYGYRTSLRFCKKARGINLKLKKQHYCFVKKVSYPIWRQATT
jgi:hypothetical protein